MTQKTTDFRLPKYASPYKYHIELKPNLEQKTFEGNVQIEINILEKTNEISLNVAELEIHEISVAQNSKIKSKVSRWDIDNEYEIMKISFDDYLSDLTKHQFSVNVLDADAEYFGKKPKRVPIDKQLLKDLLSFRNLLVTSIIKNNSIKEEDAEQAAQKILNRLIFIRSCGDRKIEERYLKASLADWEQDKSKKLIEYLREIFAYLTKLTNDEVDKINENQSFTSTRSI